jgi:single-strand DNA-binding protein
MNLLTGNFRLGQDGEVRYTQNSSAYMALSLATDYGKPDATGKRQTQWIRATLWGSRAEELADKAVKGSSCWAALSDLHIREYEGKSGPGVSLEARVEILHIYPRREGSEPQQRHQDAKANGYQAQQKFQSLPDDDVPF